MMTFFLQKLLLFLLGAVLILNLTQRKSSPHGEKKRFATLYMAGVLLVFLAGTVVISRFRLPDILLLAPAAITGFLFYFFRKKILIFNLRCLNCGRRLSIKEFLYHDFNLCSACSSGGNNLSDI
ncbi:MAG: hypothetical protein AB1798_21585 [Spirochaetota bacterium]